MATPSGVQGQLLEITVVGCNKLRDTELVSRQDPYVCLEYATNKFRSRTHTDGGKNPTFNEKFSLTLIEGLREVALTVWNSNTITRDDFIGSGKIQLNKVLSQGYDDTNWSILSRRGKYAGEVRVIMHYANAQSSLAANHPMAPPYPSPSPAPYHHRPPPPVPLPSAGYPSPYPSQPPTSAPYPPTAHFHLPSMAHFQPPSMPPAPPAPYPQQTYPPPVNPYPPTANPYPPPSSQPYPPPAHHVGLYPPPPY